MILQSSISIVDTPPFDHCWYSWYPTRSSLAVYNTARTDQSSSHLPSLSLHSLPAWVFFYSADGLNSRAVSNRSLYRAHRTAQKAVDFKETTCVSCEHISAFEIDQRQGPKGQWDGQKPHFLYRQILSGNYCRQREIPQSIRLRRWDPRTAQKEFLWLRKSRKLRETYIYG